MPFSYRVCARFIPALASGFTQPHYSAPEPNRSLSFGWHEGLPSGYRVSACRAGESIPRSLEMKPERFLYLGAHFFQSVASDDVEDSLRMIFLSFIAGGRFKSTWADRCIHRFLRTSPFGKKGRPRISFVENTHTDGQVLSWDKDGLPSILVLECCEKWYVARF